MRISSCPTVCVGLSLAVYCVTLAITRGPLLPAVSAAGVPKLGAVLPVLSGYAAPFRQIAPVPAHTCRLIHYSTQNCEYCRWEQGAWQEAAADAVAAHCTVTELAPFPSALPGYGDPTVTAPALVLVPVEWAEAAPLRGLPTTLLVDRNGKLIWSHAGALDAGLYKSLSKSLSSLER